MKISELSRRTGVPLATVKYYLREGLLPPGRPTAANQADYDDEHLERLQLVRALREGADLSVETLKRVFAAMDEARDGRPAYLSMAVGALSEPRGDATPDEPAETAVATLLDHLGWDVDPTSPGRSDLVAAIAVLQRFLPDLVADPLRLVPHAEAVRRLADVELTDAYDPVGEPEGALRLAVLGTVLLEPVLTSLRRLAHVDRLRSIERARRAVSGRRGGRGSRARPR